MKEKKNKNKNYSLLLQKVGNKNPHKSQSKDEVDQTTKTAAIE